MFWIDLPKKATDTASNASEISGENMRIPAAARIAPARPCLESTSGANASTKRSTNTSTAGRCRFNIDIVPDEVDESDPSPMDMISPNSPSSSSPEIGSLKLLSGLPFLERLRIGMTETGEPNLS